MAFSIMMTTANKRQARPSSTPVSPSAPQQISQYDDDIQLVDQQNDSDISTALKHYECLLAANILPDTAAIESVLMAYAQASKHVKGMELIRDVAGLGVQPTKYMYRIVLGFIFKRKNTPDFDALKALCSDKITEAAALFLMEEAFRMR